MDGERAVGPLEIATQLFNKVGGKLVRTFLGSQLNGMRLCFFALSDGDFLLCDHSIDGVIPAHERAFGMRYWRIIDW